MRFFAALLCLFFIAPLNAQNKAVLWQGFKHQWTYNHRINRLGDFIDSRKDSFFHVHTSASGLGADSTYYTGYFSELNSHGLQFHTGIFSLELKGREKKMMSIRKKYTIPLEKGASIVDQCQILLNGFDVKAVNAADKLQLLSIQLENPSWNPQQHSLEIELSVEMAVNCESIECQKFNQSAAYDMDVYYLIVAAPKDQLCATTATIQQTQSWDKKTEQQDSSIRKVFCGNQKGSFDHAVLGLSGFSVQLNKAHWMMAFENSIQQIEYHPETAKLSAFLQLSFKNWRKGMKRHSAKPAHSKFSSRKAGWGIISANTVLLQMKETTVKQAKIEGGLYWKGMNGNCLHPKALDEKFITKQ